MFALCCAMVWDSAKRCGDQVSGMLVDRIIMSLTASCVCTGYALYATVVASLLEMPSPWAIDVVTMDFSCHGSRGSDAMPSKKCYEFIGQEVLAAATRTPLPEGGKLGE